MINRKRGKEPVFHLRLHKSKQQAILLCSQENVPLLSHFVLCKIDWIFLQIRLVFKSQCVSGPSSFTQVVQVGCRQHPSFLSLALWGNRVAPPFPLSFASLLSANSFSSTLTCVDLRMTGQSSSPRGEEKRVRERERVKKPCPNWPYTGSGRQIYCLQGTKNHCRSHFCTWILSYTHKHMPYYILRRWG